MTDRPAWINTTHDWAATIDLPHLEAIRAGASEYAAGGLLHLVLEVMAYSNDEAKALGRRGSCIVTPQPEGVISVADNGRGTDTRRDTGGILVKKAVMSTKDLRFFEPTHNVRLPDGQPRRGMSVVSALSTWLVHTNQRINGAWQQRYEYGVPTTGLVPIAPTQSTGTTVRFLVDSHLVPTATVDAEELRRIATFPWLKVDIRVA